MGIKIQEIRQKLEGLKFPKSLIVSLSCVRPCENNFIVIKDVLSIHTMYKTKLMPKMKNRIFFRKEIC